MTTFFLVLSAFFCHATPVNTDKVEVPAHFKSCHRNTDCIKLEQLECSQCCAEDAINKNFLTRYQRLKKARCQGYDGPVCDCSGSDQVPACQNRACILVNGPPND